MPNPKPTFDKIREMFKAEFGIDPGYPQTIKQKIKHKITLMLRGKGDG